MAKAGITQGRNSKSDRKTRGRTAITGIDPVNPTTPHVPQTVKREANRPVKAGSGKHRGDRRDMSPTYTGTQKHAARGSNNRPDVETRKR